MIEICFTCDICHGQAITQTNKSEPDGWISLVVTGTLQAEKPYAAGLDGLDVEEQAYQAAMARWVNNISQGLTPTLHICPECRRQRRDIWEIIEGYLGGEVQQEQRGKGVTCSLHLIGGEQGLPDEPPRDGELA